jgi:hypothetical protein
MRRALLALASLVLSAGASAASAQVIYQPVTYQWQSPNGGGHYYYGGTNPHVHAHANANSLVPGYGRTGGYAFQSGDYQVHREVVTEPTRIYSDAVSYSHNNARFYGMRIHNAANEANANAATYFRKADLEKNAILQDDGTWLVPAYNIRRSHVSIRPYVKPADTNRVMNTTKPKAEPKPVLIIPKRLLDKKLWGEDNFQAAVDQK